MSSQSGKSPWPLLRVSRAHQWGGSRASMYMQHNVSIRRDANRRSTITKALACHPCCNHSSSSLIVTQPFSRTTPTDVFGYTIFRIRFRASILSELNQSLMGRASSVFFATGSSWSASTIHFEYFHSDLREYVAWPFWVCTLKQPTATVQMSFKSEVQKMCRRAWQSRSSGSGGDSFLRRNGDRREAARMRIKETREAGEAHWNGES